MAASDDTRKRSNATPLSQLLRSLRTTADLTQEELAERAGVSARLISDLERAQILRPRRDTIQMLADGLELTGDERDAFIETARGRSGAATSADAAGAPVRQVNLPLPPAGIVGREREVSATTSLLHQPEVRLLTLTGAGGVGKTRLALESAATVGETFTHGAVFVDLAPLADPALVIPTIARAIGVKDGGDSPPIEQLVEALQDMQLLIVLDNLEHLIAVAPDIARLLERCPGLTLLATSRQPLRVRAEREYPVTPLAVSSRIYPTTCSTYSHRWSIRACSVRSSRPMTGTHRYALASGCWRPFENTAWRNLRPQVKKRRHGPGTRPGVLIWLSVPNRS